MADPKAEDIGRSVIYVPRHGSREQGVITSFNARFVFVRYGSGSTSAATSRDDLEWAHPERQDEAT